YSVGRDAWLQRLNLVLHDHRARIVDDVELAEGDRTVVVQLAGTELYACKIELTAEEPGGNWRLLAYGKGAARLVLRLEEATVPRRMRVQVLSCRDASCIDERYVEPDYREAVAEGLANAYDDFRDVIDGGGLGVLSSAPISVMEAP